jgi:diguanylate cyclase (GGDEF)-like protein
LVTNGKRIVSANKCLLDFFGVESPEEFLQSQNCICESFLPQEGFLECDGKSTWLETTVQNTAESIESLAKIHDKKRGVERIFSVRAVKFDLNSGHVLVSLQYITEIYLQRELLENQRKELEKLATTDSLTGIYNRNRLKEIALYEFKKIKRDKYPLSLVMFDIDHFKKINDTFGHNVGDYTLKAVASLVGSLIRESDTFARWGGEEFIILAPNTGLQNAAILAEKLRASIEAYNFETVGRVTSSFGVAEASTNRLDFEELVERTDKALYVAKKGGRNRVELFSN